MQSTFANAAAKQNGSLVTSMSNSTSGGVVKKKKMVTWADQSDSAVPMFEIRRFESTEQMGADVSFEISGHRFVSKLLSDHGLRSVSRQFEHA
jgi:hypothetical protein